jgi:hypothetical protein
MPTSNLTRALLAAVTLAAITVASSTAALAYPADDAGDRFRQGEVASINQQHEATHAGDRFRQGEVASINQPAPTTAPAQSAASTGHGLNGLVVAALLALLGLGTAATAWWLTGRRPQPREAA